MFLSVFSSLYVVYHVLTYLPLIDFRPYAVGKNIKEGMQYNENGDIPPVHDFYLESDTEELSETILNAPKALLIIANKLEQTNQESWTGIIELAKNAQEKGYLVYGISSSSSLLVKNTINENNLPFEILFCDATTLKTMVRANPGILVLENAKVTQKKSWKNSNEIKL
jgi:antitoxin component of RelBE/YafQ-DinJ toxin-antitoxin module